MDIVIIFATEESLQIDAIELLFRAGGHSISREEATGVYACSRPGYAYLAPLFKPAVSQRRLARLLAIYRKLNPKEEAGGASDNMPIDFTGAQSD